MTQSIPRRGVLRAGGAALLAGGLAPAVAACGTGIRKGQVGGQLDFMGSSVVNIIQDVPEFRTWLDRNDVYLRGNFPPDDGAKIAKLAAGGAHGTSLVMWIDQFRSGWLGADVLEPLDLGQIPNLRNLIPGFGGPDAMRARKDSDGNTVGIPFAWNVLGIAYDADSVPEPASYYDFLNPEWKGKFTMLDAAGAVMSIGCQMLRYDPATLSPRQLDEVSDLLARLVRQARSLAKTDGDSFTLLASGEVLASLPGTPESVVNTAARGKGSIRCNTNPKEGGISWSSMYGIPKGAGNPTTSHAFINQALTVPVGRAIARRYGAMPSVEGALSALPQWYTDSVPIDPLERTFATAPTTYFPAIEARTPAGVTYRTFMAAWQRAKQKAGRA
ncbi:extracellular solute-binding protein [Streptomyces sp. B-S-A8]|uniref:Extracellular solute-binding protein n=1 Tax=Streptomyces solicavernae TaxID=3043614 RepID=A0ABT6RTR1_9ACTN|nr:extracellular solute-binding protein [Streptomyces sp. B-S-A8]MDI3387823.1 extracellular solute-binding protein [Streptomyces sp. B-S-A8]